jgi:hypothetical protein
LKTIYLSSLIALLCLSISVNIYQSIPETVENNFDNPTIIWNDDLEGIPADGTPILLEFTSNDTIYIGVLETETNLPEYQFTTTDDSISVQDFDRYVGTVKLEGQLKQLIDQDNE